MIAIWHPRSAAMASCLSKRRDESVPCFPFCIPNWCWSLRSWLHDTLHLPFRSPLSLPNSLNRHHYHGVFFPFSVQSLFFRIFRRLAIFLPNPSSLTCDHDGSSTSRPRTPTPIVYITACPSGSLLSYLLSSRPYARPALLIPPFHLIASAPYRFNGPFSVSKVLPVSLWTKYPYPPT